MKPSIFSILILLAMSCCATVKNYEKQFVNDPEMKMENDAGKNFNNYVYSIREGAIPPGSTKGNGGCGCN